MRWLRWATRRRPIEDPTMAALTAQADLIMEELDTVVKQMSAMLRERAAEDDE